MALHLPWATLDWDLPFEISDVPLMIHHLVETYSWINPDQQDVSQEITNH